TVAQQLLEVNDLHTQFFTRDGVVHAVDGVSFELAAGETLGIVGESGCGKSVTALSLMRLIPQPPGRITQGSIVFDGQDVLKMDDDDVRSIRGNNIAMIFQDPMTSLNPVLTISRQISEPLKTLAREFRTAFILITHDLGVVAGMTQRIHVMYAGKIVEKADTTELFANPKMPYTWGLLRSIPRLDEHRKAKLVPIEGLPPDLIAPPPGCRFEPRCQYRHDVCKEKEPELTHIPNAKSDHEA